jgi:predicted nucleotidyltransferase
MNNLTATLINIVELLDKNSIPYMVIGGIANLTWGEPRSTFDIDITVDVDEKDIDDTVGLFKENYEILCEAPVQFVKKNRVLPLLDSVRKVKIDLIFGLLSYEKEAIRRARDVETEGRTVKVCTPEDIIIHKIHSERDKDQLDVKNIIRINRDTLDRDYLDIRIKELSKLLEASKLYEKYLNYFKKQD